MIASMRAKTNWNVDGPMLWGYFFTNRSADKVEKAATRLAAQGYRLVGIHETDDASTRALHVERSEIHSPQTLFDRNEILDRLAFELGLDSYDGMDVGPLPS